MAVETESGIPSLCTASKMKSRAKDGKAARKSSKSVALVLRVSVEATKPAVSMSMMFCNISLPRIKPLWVSVHHSLTAGSKQRLRAMANSFASVLAPLSGRVHEGLRTTSLGVAAWSEPLGKSHKNELLTPGGSQPELNHDL